MSDAISGIAVTCCNCRHTEAGYVISLGDTGDPPTIKVTLPKGWRVFTGPPWPRVSCAIGASDRHLHVICRSCDEGA